MFGYIDESGTPGIATYPKDCLVVSMVIFDTEMSREKALAAIEKLRRKLKLPENYEFHCSSNSTRPQNEFLKLLTKLDFKFITIAIHKNDLRKTATYVKISEALVDEIEKYSRKINIEMDINPTLYKDLRRAIREHGLRHVKLRERNSRNHPLIQIADYVVNISSNKARNTRRSSKLYKMIENKILAFVEI